LEENPVKKLIALTTLAALTAAANAQTVVAYDNLGDDGNLNLVSANYNNQDGGPGDWWGVGSRNAWPQGFPSPGVPFGLADDTVFGYSNGGAPFSTDTEGVYGINSDYDNDFFGLADSDALNQTASWTFDVSGYTDLNLSVDIAGISNSSFGGYAIGQAYIDFEVSIDGSPFVAAMSVDAVSGGFVTRLMDNGAQSGGGSLLQVTGPNGVTKYSADTGLAVADTYTDKSVVATGAIDSFVTALNGAGSQLTLRVNANMPFEAAAFDNIVITGVPEPASLILLGLAGLLIRRR
jgi:hypothetical protein